MRPPRGAGTRGSAGIPAVWGGGFRGGARREAGRAARPARAMQCAEGAAWGASPALLSRAHRQRGGPLGALELGGRWSEDTEVGTASKRNRGVWRAGREVYLGGLQGKAPTWDQAGGLDRGNKRRACWGEKLLARVNWE